MTAEKCAQPLIWSGKVIERINKFSQIIVELLSKKSEKMHFQEEIKK